MPTPASATPSTSSIEQAGASAIQLEDQHAPKRCGHFSGKELIPAEEMVNKVRAAVDTRRDGLVIIARTDACAVEGFDAAIDRARRYIEAGADVTFVEAPGHLLQAGAEIRHLSGDSIDQLGLFAAHGLYFGPSAYFKLSDTVIFKVAWSAGRSQAAIGGVEFDLKRGMADAEMGFSRATPCRRASSRPESGRTRCAVSAVSVVLIAQMCSNLKSAMRDYSQAHRRFLLPLNKCLTYIATSEGRTAINTCSSRNIVICAQVKFSIFSCCNQMDHASASKK